jgi:predicted Zn-dependent protease with MMP-like domain
MSRAARRRRSSRNTRRSKWRPQVDHIRSDCSCARASQSGTIAPDTRWIRLLMAGCRSCRDDSTFIPRSRLYWLASQARLCSVGSVLVQRDEPTRSGVSPIGRQRRRRDRHGRGLRGAIAPVGVPIARSSGDQFDELVLDAVEELERAWAKELAAVEFAVEDVPPAATTDTDIEFNPEVVADGPVPLGRLYRGGVESIKSPVIVIYRRPVEARTADKSERADLVFAVVAELVAELLGRDLDEIDPP